MAMIYDFSRRASDGFGLCGMWLGSHIRACTRGMQARAAAAVLLLAVGGAVSAVGQPAGQSQLTGQGLWPAVGEGHARSAQRLVEQWVQRGGVPGERAGAIRVSGLVGVRVTLRSAGITLGDGTVFRSDLEEALQSDAVVEPGTPLPASDLVGLLEQATTRAFDDVMARLESRGFEARARAGAGGDSGGGIPTREQIGVGLEVDLQIARGGERVVVRGDAPAGAVFGRFAPGFHGLLVLATASQGAQPVAVWPATGLAINLSPRRQVMRVLSGAGKDALASASLGRPGGVPLYRFDTLHVVRPRAGMVPTVLVRGGELLPGRFVGQQMLAGMSERMARNLLNRFISGQRVRGTYHPASDRFDPELADEQEATLASLALMRYARASRRRGASNPLLTQFEEVAAGVVNRVTGRLLVPDDLDEPVIAGLALLTMLDAPAAAFEPALRDRLATLLSTPVAALDGDNAAPVMPPASEALVAAALAGRYAQNRDVTLGGRVADALTALWERTDGGFDVFALPWALEAHLVASGSLIADGLLDPAVAQARATGLATLLDQVERLQVIERPALGPADVMGGIVLRAAPEGSPPAPTWHTAHVVRFLALALRDQQAVPVIRRPGAMVTASAAARFLGQLMIDEPNCFGIPNPGQALGGIRLALFDNTLGVAPTAVTLLAMTELSSTLHAIEVESDAPAEESAAEPDAEPGA